MFGETLAVPRAILLQPKWITWTKVAFSVRQVSQALYSATFSLLSLDDGFFYSLGASFEEGCINAPFESTLPPSTPYLRSILTFR